MSHDSTNSLSVSKFSMARIDRALDVHENEKIPTSSLDRVASWSSTGRALLPQDTLQRMSMTLTLQSNTMDIPKGVKMVPASKSQSWSSKSWNQKPRSHTSMEKHDVEQHDLPMRAQSTLPLHVAPYAQIGTNQSAAVLVDLVPGQQKFTEVRHRLMDASISDVRRREPYSHPKDTNNLALLKDQVNTFEETVASMEKRLGIYGDVKLLPRSPEQSFDALFASTRLSNQNPIDSSRMEPIEADINDIEAYLAKHKRYAKMPRAATEIQKWWRMTISRIKYKRFRRAISLFKKRFAMLCCKHWRWACIAEDCLRYKKIGKPLWAWRLLARNKVIWDEESAIIFLECARIGGIPQRQLFSQVSDREAYISAGKEHNYGQGYMFGRPLNTREHVIVAQLLRRMLIWNGQSRLKRWRKRAIWCVEQVEKGQAKLQKVAAKLLLERLWLSLVMWYRMTVVQKCNQKVESWPDFEPNLPIWISWVRSHDNKKRLASQQVTVIRSRFYCRHMWLRWIRYREYLQHKNDIMTHIREHERRSTSRRYLTSWFEAEKYTKAAKYRLSAIMKQVSYVCKGSKRKRHIEVVIQKKWIFRLMKPVFESIRTLATSMLIIRAGSLRRIRDQASRALWSIFAWLSVCSPECNDPLTRKPGGLIMLGICDAHFHFCDCWRLWSAMARRRLQFRNFVHIRYQELVLHGFLRLHLTAWRYGGTIKSSTATQSVAGRSTMKMKKDRTFLSCLDPILIPKIVALCLLRSKHTEFLVSESERVAAMNQSEKIQIRARQYLKVLSDVLSSGGIGLKNFMAQERERTTKVILSRADCFNRDYKILLAKELQDSLQAFGQVYDNEYNQSRQHPSFKSEELPIVHENLSPVQNWFPEFPDYVPPTVTETIETKFYAKSHVKRILIDDASSSMMTWIRQHKDLMPFCSTIIGSDNSEYSLQVKEPLKVENDLSELKTQEQPAQSQSSAAEPEPEREQAEATEISPILLDTKADDEVSVNEGNSMWDYERNRRRIQTGVNDILIKLQEKLEVEASEQLPLERKSILKEIPGDSSFESPQHNRLSHLVATYGSLRAQQLGQDSTAVLMDGDSEFDQKFASFNGRPKRGLTEFPTEISEEKMESKEMKDQDADEEIKAATFHGINVALDLAKPRKAMLRWTLQNPEKASHIVKVKAPVYFHKPQANACVATQSTSVPQQKEVKLDEKEESKDEAETEEVEINESKENTASSAGDESHDHEEAPSQTSDHFDVMFVAENSPDGSDRWSGSADESKSRAVDEKERVWKDLMNANVWIQQETAEIRQAMKGGLDSLYWRSQVVSKRSKRQLEVKAAIEKDFQISRQIHAARVAKIAENVWADGISDVLANLQTATAPFSMAKQRAKTPKTKLMIGFTGPLSSESRGRSSKGSSEYCDFGRMTPIAISACASPSPFIPKHANSQDILGAISSHSPPEHTGGATVKAHEKLATNDPGIFLAVDVKLLSGTSSHTSIVTPPPAIIVPPAAKAEENVPTAHSKSAYNDRVSRQNLTCRPSTSLEMSFPDRNSLISAGRPRSQRPRSSQSFSHSVAINVPLKREMTDQSRPATGLRDLVIVNGGVPAAIPKFQVSEQNSAFEDLREALEQVVGPARARFSIGGGGAKSSRPISRASSQRAATPVSQTNTEFKVHAIACDPIKPKTPQKIEGIPISKAQVESIKVKVICSKTTGGSSRSKTTSAPHESLDPDRVEKRFTSSGQLSSVELDKPPEPAIQQTSLEHGSDQLMKTTFKLEATQMRHDLTDVVHCDIAWRPWTGVSASEILDELRMLPEGNVSEGDVGSVKNLLSDTEVIMLEEKYVNPLPVEYFDNLVDLANLASQSIVPQNLPDSAKKINKEFKESSHQNVVESFHFSEGAEGFEIQQIMSVQPAHRLVKPTAITLEQDYIEISNCGGTSVQNRSLDSDFVKGTYLGKGETTISMKKESDVTHAVSLPKHTENLESKRLSVHSQAENISVMSETIKNTKAPITFRKIARQNAKTGVNNIAHLEKPLVSTSGKCISSRQSAESPQVGQPELELLLTTKRMQTPGQIKSTTSRIPTRTDVSVEKHLSAQPVYDPSYVEHFRDENCLLAQKVVFTDKQIKKPSRAVTPIRNGEHIDRPVTVVDVIVRREQNVDMSTSQIPSFPPPSLGGWSASLQEPTPVSPFYGYTSSQGTSRSYPESEVADHLPPQDGDESRRHSLEIQKQPEGPLGKHFESLVQPSSLKDVANEDVAGLDPPEEDQSSSFKTEQSNDAAGELPDHSEQQLSRKSSINAPVSPSNSDSFVQRNLQTKETSVEELLRSRVKHRKSSEVDQVFAFVPAASVPGHNEFVAYVSKELEGQDDQPDNKADPARQSSFEPRTGKKSKSRHGSRSPKPRASTPESTVSKLVLETVPDTRGSSPEDSKGSNPQNDNRDYSEPPTSRSVDERKSPHRSKKDLKVPKRKPIPIDLFKNTHKAQKSMAGIPSAPWNDKSSPLTQTNIYAKNVSDSDNEGEAENGTPKPYGMPLRQDMLTPCRWTSSPSLLLAREVDRYFENARLKRLQGGASRQVTTDVVEDGQRQNSFTESGIRDVMLMGRNNVIPSGIYDTYLHTIRSKNEQVRRQEAAITSLAFLPSMHAPRPGEILRTTRDEED